MQSACTRRKNRSIDARDRPGRYGSRGGAAARRKATRAGSAEPAQFGISAGRHLGFGRGLRRTPATLPGHIDLEQITPCVVDLEGRVLDPEAVDQQALELAAGRV